MKDKLRTGILTCHRDESRLKYKVRTLLYLLLIKGILTERGRP